MAMDPFVDADWLAAHRNEAILADVRWYLDGRSGRDAYESGHIPGAVFVDLDEVLAAPSSDAEGRHPLPAPERFASDLGRLGIGDAALVVGYDDQGGVFAARLVWMLRAIGHQAALLDGGLRAWNGELESGPPTPRPAAEFTPAPWPADRVVSIEQVAAVAGAVAGSDEAGGTVLIDARDRARFAGAPSPLDPRTGHIPGARNVPTREHLGADDRIDSVDELRATFAAVGIAPGTPVISSCGSGVTACHNLLALERAGLGPGRLYAGSWSQWSRDPSRPIEAPNRASL